MYTLLTDAEMDYVAPEILNGRDGPAGIQMSCLCSNPENGLPVVEFTLCNPTAARCGDCGREYLLRLGRVVATPGALRTLEENHVNASDLLARHQTGDWGSVSPDDAKENDLSVRQGFRILSSYSVGAEKVWVLTEANRSATTFLLPEEY